MSSNKKRTAPAGLDYSPVMGDARTVSFGVIQTRLPQQKPDLTADVGTTTAEGAIFRRLFPIQKPADPTRPWDKPTCAKWDVLLPEGASDDYLDPQQLARAYDRQAFGVIRDLLVIITLRFPEVDAALPTMKLHEAWELSRSFANEKLVMERRLAVVPVLHVPGRAAKPGFPHVHLMTFARELLPSSFGMFSRSIASDEGRCIIDKEWAEWRRTKGTRG